MFHISVGKWPAVFWSLLSPPVLYNSLTKILEYHKVKMQYARRRQWHPTPVLLPGKSHGWRSLVGCSPWSCEELDTTEWLPFHFSLSCIGEGNDNPLQCSCLENLRDRGAWWAAVYGAAQSRTQLKWLSSSSILIFIVGEPTYIPTNPVQEFPFLHTLTNIYYL